jgi:y4mF family transcriptional regulator
MSTKDTYPPDSTINQELEALGRAVAQVRQLSTNVPDLSRAIRDATKAIESIDPSTITEAARAIDFSQLPTIYKLSQAIAGPLSLPKLASVNGIEPGATVADKSDDEQSSDVAASQFPIAAAVDIGSLVKKAREARHLSQQSFADLAGVGRRFVSELENGKPTLEFEKVVKVSRAAGISLLAVPR